MPSWNIGQLNPQQSQNQGQTPGLEFSSSGSIAFEISEFTIFVTLDWPGLHPVTVLDAGD